MVFNAVSWETHFASAHAADVLEAIGELRVTVLELIDLLISPGAVEEERAELLRLIAGLEDLGLICRV